MANRQQTDPTAAIPGKGNPASKPQETQPSKRKGGHEDAAGGPEARPGSDPKNPGDFGHH